MKFFDLELGGLGAKAVVYDDKRVGGCLQTTYTNGTKLKYCEDDHYDMGFIQYVGGFNGDHCDSTYRSAKSCKSYIKP